MYINETASNLPYGEQRCLEIARALATDPFLLLLDEPVAGMNAQETKELEETINIIRDKEHIILARDIANKGYVLQNGVIKMADTAAHLLENEEVRKAYLGLQEIGSIL